MNMNINDYREKPTSYVISICIGEKESMPQFKNTNFLLKHTNAHRDQSKAGRFTLPRGVR